MEHCKNEKDHNYVFSSTVNHKPYMGGRDNGRGGLVPEMKYPSTDVYVCHCGKIKRVVLNN